MGANWGNGQGSEFNERLARARHGVEVWVVHVTHWDLAWVLAAINCLASHSVPPKNAPRNAGTLAYTRRTGGGGSVRALRTRWGPVRAGRAAEVGERSTRRVRPRAVAGRRSIPRRRSPAPAQTRTTPGRRGSRCVRPLSAPSPSPSVLRAILPHVPDRAVSTTPSPPVRRGVRVLSPNDGPCRTKGLVGRIHPPLQKLPP